MILSENSRSQLNDNNRSGLGVESDGLYGRGKKGNFFRQSLSSFSKKLPTDRQSVGYTSSNPSQHSALNSISGASSRGKQVLRAKLESLKQNNVKNSKNLKNIKNIKKNIILNGKNRSHHDSSSPNLNKIQRGNHGTHSTLKKNHSSGDLRGKNGHNAHPTANVTTKTKAKVDYTTFDLNLSIACPTILLHSTNPQQIRSGVEVMQFCPNFSKISQNSQLFGNFGGFLEQNSANNRNIPDNIQIGGSIGRKFDNDVVNFKNSQYNLNNISNIHQFISPVVGQFDNKNFSHNYDEEIRTDHFFTSLTFFKQKIPLLFQHSTLSHSTQSPESFINVLPLNPTDYSEFSHSLDQYSKVQNIHKNDQFDEKSGHNEKINLKVNQTPIISSPLPSPTHSKHEISPFLRIHGGKSVSGLSTPNIDRDRSHFVQNSQQFSQNSKSVRSSSIQQERLHHQHLELDYMLFTFLQLQSFGKTSSSLKYASQQLKKFHQAQHPQHPQPHSSQNPHHNFHHNFHDYSNPNFKTQPNHNFPSISSHPFFTMDEESYISDSFNADLGGVICIELGDISIQTIPANFSQKDKSVLKSSLTNTSADEPPKTDASYIHKHNTPLVVLPPSISINLTGLSIGVRPLVPYVLLSC